MLHIKIVLERSVVLKNIEDILCHPISNCSTSDNKRTSLATTDKAMQDIWMIHIIWIVTQEQIGHRDIWHFPVGPSLCRPSFIICTLLLQCLLLKHINMHRSQLMCNTYY